MSGRRPGGRAINSGGFGSRFSLTDEGPTRGIFADAKTGYVVLRIEPRAESRPYGFQRPFRRSPMPTHYPPRLRPASGSYEAWRGFLRRAIGQISTCNRSDFDVQSLRFRRAIAQIRRAIAQISTCNRSDSTPAGAAPQVSAERQAVAPGAPSQARAIGQIWHRLGTWCPGGGGQKVHNFADRDA